MPSGCGGHGMQASAAAWIGDFAVLAERGVCLSGDGARLNPIVRTSRPIPLRWRIHAIQDGARRGRHKPTCAIVAVAEKGGRADGPCPPIHDAGSIPPPASGAEAVLGLEGGGGWVGGHRSRPDGRPPCSVTGRARRSDHHRWRGSRRFQRSPAFRVSAWRDRRIARVGIAAG